MLFDSTRDLIFFPKKNGSIQLTTQVVLKYMIRFDSRFHQKLFVSDSIHNSTRNRLQVCAADRIGTVPCLYRKVGTVVARWRLGAREQILCSRAVDKCRGDEQRAARRAHRQISLLCLLFGAIGSLSVVEPPVNTIRLGGKQRAEHRTSNVPHKSRRQSGRSFQPVADVLAENIPRL